jgi:hypothetical protein
MYISWVKIAISLIFGNSLVEILSKEQIAVEIYESYSSSSQQASFNYHFAPIQLTSNGDSSVVFDIAVHKLKFRSGSISTMSNIGKY